MIRLRQVAPVCRSAGRLLLPARNGPNRFRFDGRLSGRPLHDGTYVATTPSGTVRFAIVDGKPTRSARRLSPSVCDSGALGASTLVAGTPSPKSSLPRTAASATANNDRAAADQGGPLPRVLGTTFTEAAEAAASLNPAFYLLLALAMVALAATTVPARVLPAATAVAAVALTGTVCLLMVIVVYLVTPL